ncbi:mechanosensitive ion channel family protein [Aliiroseovarius sp. PrR006]|uniref:mechanosensitive ion channel family protein n=1 Tax=Aliiroseovarius sp. PrR006 TaxID=2706883 RepID=UPI0013D1D9E7|nr:mechanosensitive ion channel domain-containing protein [Aliiroseovarius sp. PrR006]NDW53713.1 mechanosensitive ion channel [Aliiroseovarius sp. PrR006]
METLLEQVQSYGPLVLNVAKAFATLVIGWIVAGAAGSLARRKVNTTPHIDPTLGNFIASMVKWVILLMVLAAVLSIFGIQATSLVAMLSAATLAIGLALQGTLSDIAAGFMLTLFRPYKLGQFVDIGGTAGTVKDLNLFVTELVTPDNVQVIVPNGQAWGSIIRNFSHHDTRRVDMVFGIDYADDIDKAMQIITDLAEADPRVHADPAPWVRVTNLGDSSVDLTTRVWCDNAEYWNVKFELTKAVKETFDAKGISIPYPHSVEIKKEA